VLVVRTPDERLTFLQPIPSRRKGDVAGGIPGPFAGSLITDGCTGYQHLLERLAGIQQCCADVISRCRPCPAGAASAATSIQPQTAARPRSTPSARLWSADPGFPRYGRSLILVARWCGMGESLRPAAGVTGLDASTVYPLGSSRGESARLRRQAEELAADSAALLNRIGLLPGQSAIDLGCGPRGILDMLAERVAPAGRVVSLDADPVHTAMAAEFAAARGLSGVEIITGDAMSTGLPAGSFDLVHARTLLVNLPEPAEAAAEMTRLARPGGWVASTEPDTEHALCYPPHPAFDRLRDIFTVAFRRNGADPWIGRRVPELFRQAGLEHVGVEARVQMYPHGNSRRTIRLDLVQSMRPQVLEMGLATGTELDDLDAAARAHLDDPHTVVMSGLLFLTWGRKPDRAQQDFPRTS